MQLVEAVLGQHWPRVAHDCICTVLRRPEQLFWRCLCGMCPFDAHRMSPYADRCTDDHSGSLLQDLPLKDILVAATRYDQALVNGGYAYATIFDRKLQILLHPMLRGAAQS